MSNNEMNEEDYLKRHLQDLDEGKKAANNASNSDIPYQQQPQVDNVRVSDLQYFNFDIRELPCGQFYPS